MGPRKRTSHAFAGKGQTLGSGKVVKTGRVVKSGKPKKVSHLTLLISGTALRINSELK